MKITPFHHLHRQDIAPFEPISTQLVKNVIQSARGLQPSSPDSFVPRRQQQEPQGPTDFTKELALRTQRFLTNHRASIQGPGKGITAQEAAMVNYLLLHNAHQQETGGCSSSDCASCKDLQSMSSLMQELFVGVKPDLNFVNLSYKKPISPGTPLSAASFERNLEITPEDIDYVATLDGDGATVSQQDLAQARENLEQSFKGRLAQLVLEPNLSGGKPPSIFSTSPDWTAI